MPWALFTKALKMETIGSLIALIGQNIMLNFILAKLYSPYRMTSTHGNIGLVSFNQFAIVFCTHHGLTKFRHYFSGWVSSWWLLWQWRGWHVFLWNGNIQFSNGRFRSRQWPGWICVNWLKSKSNGNGIDDHQISTFEDTISIRKWT